MNSHRALWADSKCSRAILSPAFAPCRAEVDPTPWLELCRQVSDISRKKIFHSCIRYSRTPARATLAETASASALPWPPSPLDAPPQARQPAGGHPSYAVMIIFLHFVSYTQVHFRFLLSLPNPSPEEQPRSAAPAGPTPTACPPARRGAARTRSATRPPSACAATSPAWRGASRTGAGPARSRARSSPPSPTGPACRRPGAPGGREGLVHCGPAASPRTGGGSERGSSSNKSDARNGWGFFRGKSIFFS